MSRKPRVRNSETAVRLTIRLDNDDWETLRRQADEFWIDLPELVSQVMKRRASEIRTDALQGLAQVFVDHRPES